MGRTDRNAPCPCGSGRKHKRCCLARSERERQAARTVDRVWEELQEWTIGAHPEHLNSALAAVCGDDDRRPGEAQLDLFCSHAHLDLELPRGGTPAERFAARTELRPGERAAARSLAAARLGLWRARSVRPGESIELEEVLGGRVVTVRSDQVSRAATRWDVLLCRVCSGAGPDRLWGPAAIFPAAEEDELVAEVRRLAAAISAAPHDTFRTCAVELTRFAPPSRFAEPSFYTFEGDLIAPARARWELAGAGAGRQLERHPDLVDMGVTEDGVGLCLEWTGGRPELAARRPTLPPGALRVESTSVLLDPEGQPVTDGSLIGLGTFELRGSELSFEGLSEPRLDGAIALVAAALGERARLVERGVEPLDLEAARPAGRSPEPVPDGVGAAVMRQFARNMYLGMLDERDARFGGLTPRAAARSDRLRPAVERWLRTLENSAARGGGIPGDPDIVPVMRAELGLPEAQLPHAA